MPRGLQQAAALVLLAFGLVYMGAFEFTREGGRRPFLVHGYMYSNSIRVAEAETINRTGILQSARWSEVKSVTRENRIEAGRQIFQLACASCHAIGGPMNDILPLTAKFDAVYGMRFHARRSGQDQ